MQGNVNRQYMWYTNVGIVFILITVEWKWTCKLKNKISLTHVKPDNNGNFWQVS